MRAILLVITVLAAQSINAGPYVEVGISNLFATDYHHEYNNEKKNVFGLLEVGYNYQGFKLYYAHDSDVQQKDKGYNRIGVKYYYEFK